MSINRNPMDPRRVDEVVRNGDVEIWEIRDEEALSYHTVHIHGVQFLLLDRDGQAPSEGERAWKDTVLVNPFETVLVIARFGDYADPHLPYMFHCHILDHEDMGMMGQFVLVDRDSEPVRITSSLTEQTRPAQMHAHGQ